MPVSSHTTPVLAEGGTPQGGVGERQGGYRDLR